MRWLLTICCLIVGVLNVKVAMAVEDSVVQQLVVVHRHGARYPVPAVNMTGVCPGGAANCGALTDQGKKMMWNLGQYLRRRYNETLSPYHRYDPNVMYSKSTDVDRTYQSAGALLAGLYAHLENTSQFVYPVIHSQEIDRDHELIVWDGWPALVMWSAATQVGFFNTVDQEILAIMSPSTLGLIGAELGLSEECDRRSIGFFPFQCAIDAGDVFSYARTAGTAHLYPVTQSAFPQLQACLEVYNRYAMGLYDQLTNSGRFLTAVGSFGYPLMMHILASIDSPAWNSTNPSQAGRRLTHFSGHDITLMPLTNTLGNDTMLNPLFGAALLIEVWGPPTNFANTSDPKFIVAKFGQPSQDFESGFEYEGSFENFTLTCIDERGNQYRSSIGCPLSDLRRYVATRGPSDSLGVCFASNTTLAALNCTPSLPAPAETYCNYYRSMCIGACGASGAMTEDLSCVSEPFHQPQRRRNHHDRNRRRWKAPRTPHSAQ